MAYLHSIAKPQSFSYMQLIIHSVNRAKSGEVASWGDSRIHAFTDRNKHAYKEVTASIISPTTNLSLIHYHLHRFQINDQFLSINRPKHEASINNRLLINHVMTDIT